MAIFKSYNRWIVVFSAAALIAIICLVLYILGWVSGQEFSPDDFSRRSFAYNKMPIFGISVRGIRYNDATPVFEQTLLADGLIAAPKPIKSWHLISDNKSDIRSSDFDARLLCRFLDLKGENNESIWIKWNEENPVLAKEFWPLIASLAQQYRYLDASKIMLRAIGIRKADVNAFRVLMLDTASKSFLEIAKNMQADGKFSEAIDLYTKSIEILPSLSAYDGRGNCFKQLGDDEKSLLDLQSAKLLEE